MDFWVPEMFGGAIGGMIVVAMLLGSDCLQNLANKSPRSFFGLKLRPMQQVKDVELLEHEERSGGIRVKCRNNEQLTAESAIFLVRIYEGERLVDQCELDSGKLPVGETSEQILKFRAFGFDPVSLKGRPYQLQFLRAYHQAKG